jgi:TonB family protein
MAIAVDTQPGSEPPQCNGTAFRVSRVLKGSLQVGQSVYSVDSQTFRLGSNYLLFLRALTSSERASHASRQGTLRLLPSMKIVTNAGAPVIPVRAGEAQIRTDELFVGAELASPERLSRLGAARQPFLLPVTSLSGTFGRYHCPPNSEDPPTVAAPQPSYAEAQVVTGTVQLVGVSIAASDDPPSIQPLLSQCPVDFLYPVQALKARLQGIVVLRGTLSAGGAIEALWVQQGVNPLLDRAALNAMSAARFPLPFVPDGRERLFTATIAFRRN